LLISKILIRVLFIAKSVYNLSKYYLIINCNYFIYENNNIGDWGLGIGDWGLGIGDWAQSPIPNPQSPNPNPHFILNQNNIF
jgi:hypothetical protein